MSVNYWAFRIDVSHRNLLYKELQEGRLRQGWGWENGQDLRNMTVDGGARRNRRMFRSVKKGDRILVPRIPNWVQVVICEATEDWDKGYQFQVLETKDHGHIFPVQLLKTFSRKNEYVPARIRSTLRTPSRFWNINYCSEDVEGILSVEESTVGGLDWTDRLMGAVEQIFADEDFKNSSVNKISAHFQAAEWEFALVDVFNSLYAEGNAERVGGKDEVRHGTDILITIPGLVPETSYCIAVQVKDHVNKESTSVVDQINKADAWWNNETRTLIEKVVVLIGANEDNNKKLADYATEHKVKILYKSDIDDMLFRFACGKAAEASRE